MKRKFNYKKKNSRHYYNCKKQVLTRLEHVHRTRNTTVGSINSQALKNGCGFVFCAIGINEDGRCAKIEHVVGVINKSAIVIFSRIKKHTRKWILISHSAVKFFQDSLGFTNIKGLQNAFNSGFDRGWVLLKVAYT